MSNLTFDSETFSRRRKAVLESIGKNAAAVVPGRKGRFRLRKSRKKFGLTAASTRSRGSNISSETLEESK